MFLKNVAQDITNGLVYNDIFDNVGNMLSSTTAKIQGIALAGVVLCIVIIGAMFLFGEGPSRTAKRWLMYVIIGCVLIFGAATIAASIKGISGF